RRSARHDAVHARRDLELDEVAQRALVDLPVAEGGDQRGEDALEHPQSPSPSGIVPRKTSTAGPVITTEASSAGQAISRVPPRSSMATARSVRPRSIEVTATAQAPLPQASVSPVPRSQVRCRTR